MKSIIPPAIFRAVVNMKPIYTIRRMAHLKFSPKPSEKVRQFFFDNQDLNLFDDIDGVGVRVVEVDTGSGIRTTLRIIVEIGEHTTSRQIIKAAPFIAELKDRLLKFQPPDLSVNINDAYLEILSNEQESGEKSYKELADRANLYGMKTTERKLKDRIRNWRKTKIHKSAQEFKKR